MSVHNYHNKHIAVNASMQDAVYLRGSKSIVQVNIMLHDSFINCFYAGLFLQLGHLVECLYVNENLPKVKQQGKSVSLYA